RVLRIVIVLRFVRPLSNVVTQHRFGMRRAHDDCVLVGYNLVLCVDIESLGAPMHRRPKGIGFESEQELEYPGVGLRTNVSELRIESLCSPWLQTKIFVIEKDATVLYRRWAFAARTSSYE